MNITITGSLGNISRSLTKKLIANGHKVTVVTHSLERAKAIEQLHAIPAVGSVDDYDFLLHAFANATAVYTMVPPNYLVENIPEYMKTIGENYVNAIEQSGVRHVVNLSSIGAHMPDGPGPLAADHYIEKILNELKETHVLHLRPSLFYTNLLDSIQMIKHKNIMGNNFDGTIDIVMSHPLDIASAAAQALDTLSFSGKNILYLSSDEKNGGEIATILGQAIGRSDLTWHCFSDEELLQGLVQNGLSEHVASVYIIEIGIALRSGLLFEDYRNSKGKAFGSISFADFAKDFASVYGKSL